MNDFIVSIISVAWCCLQIALFKNYEDLKLLSQNKIKWNYKDHILALLYYSITWASLCSYTSSIFNLTKAL